MTAEKPAHGGKRKSAGRPPKPPGEKYVLVTVSLSPKAAARAKILGGGGTTPSENLAAIRRGIVKSLAPTD